MRRPPLTFYRLSPKYNSLLEFGELYDLVMACLGQVMRDLNQAERRDFGDWIGAIGRKIAQGLPFFIVTAKVPTEIEGLVEARFKNFGIEFEKTNEE